MEALALINAPREKVYRAYTDFEAWPLWWKRTSKVTVIARDGNGVTVRSEPAPGKRRLASTSRLALSAPEAVESTSETRFTRTTWAVRFDEVQQGTQVTALLDVRMKGLWGLLLSPRGKSEAEASAEEELQAFAKYVEGLP